MKWEELFDSHSLYRLLYSLRIVTLLLRDNERAEWRAQFVSRGGLAHLYSVLLDFQLQQYIKEMQVGLAGLASLLFILRNFLLGMPHSFLT